MEAPLAPRALPRAPAVAPGTRGSARRPRLPQLWQPLCLVAAVRARRALPGRHLIQDTWYHKAGGAHGDAWPCEVGHPETCAGEDVSMEQQPVHLLQGHRDSYLHFMSRSTRVSRAVGQTPRAPLPQRAEQEAEGSAPHG